MPIKVLVVDDTLFYRKMLSDVLKSLPDVEVVGTANNGKVAMSRIRTLQPDLLTLDVEMPEMNGLQVLQEITAQGYDTECLMISSLTSKSGEIAVEALSLGALEVIPKPEEDSAEKNMERIRKELEPKLRAFARKRELKSQIRERPASAKAETRVPEARDTREIISRSKSLAERRESSLVVGVGVSTGGPKALAGLIPQLPGNLKVPLFVVQHMPEFFTSSLAANLDAKSAVEVREAADGEIVRAGCVYLAPGGYQMMVASAARGEKVFRVKDDPPENNCKPSVDYLFRSIAREYGSRSTGVVMTGMGSDGKLGSRVLKASGGVILAQDAETSVVYGMAKGIIEEGLADVVAPLEQIGPEILKTL